MLKTARKVVTIDGLAASGKSTLAKLLAKELGYLHLNTGLLYRAAALLAIENKINSAEVKKVEALLRRHNFAFEYSPDKGSRILIDSSDRTEDLQSQEIAHFTSEIAALSEVRKILRDLQIQAFPTHSIVAEGRDTGTIIFPDAIVKFFIEGDPLVRATRRALDLNGQLSKEELELVSRSVAEELKQRDERDLKREIAPVKPASDAIIIDNTKGILQETVARMAQDVKSKIAQ